MRVGIYLASRSFLQLMARNLGRHCVVSWADNCLDEFDSSKVDLLICEHSKESVELLIKMKIQILFYSVSPSPESVALAQSLKSMGFVSGIDEFEVWKAAVDSIGFGKKYFSSNCIERLENSNRAGLIADLPLDDGHLLNSVACGRSVQQLASDFFVSRSLMYARLRKLRESLECPGREDLAKLAESIYENKL